MNLKYYDVYLVPTFYIPSNQDKTSDPYLSYTSSDNDSVDLPTNAQHSHVGELSEVSMPTSTYAQPSTPIIQTCNVHVNTTGYANTLPVVSYKGSISQDVHSLSTHGCRHTAEFLIGYIFSQCLILCYIYNNCFVDENMYLYFNFVFTTLLAHDNDFVLCITSSTRYCTISITNYVVLLSSLIYLI